jgi:adenylylsulfate kinase
LTEHIFAHDHPESDRRRDGGFTLWFTGLSGAGKSTIAHLVGPELERRGHVVEYLDGDTVRTHLSKGLGFSKEDRDTNIERIGWVASRLTRHGAAVLASAISPYAETRQKARAMVEEWGTFVEVHVDCSVDECARRDVKGLYEKAFKGEIKGFTGVDDPYEAPSNPELRVDTEKSSAEAIAQQILAKLRQLWSLTARLAAQEVKAPTRINDAVMRRIHRERFVTESLRLLGGILPRLGSALLTYTGLLVRQDQELAR